MFIDNYLLGDARALWILRVLKTDCLFYPEWEQRYARR